MERTEYWNEEYVKYWKSMTDAADQENSCNESSGSKGNSVDNKTVGEGVANLLFEGLCIKGTDKLLDYGCGFGRFYPVLSGKCDYFGIDISKAMIDRFIQDHPEAATNLSVSEGEHLPFQDGFFDKIVCFGVFDACYQKEALNEMLRVTKVGGMILITGKNTKYFSDDEEASIAEEAARAKQHPNYFTDVRKMKKMVSPGVEFVQERYFLRRGDFGENRYITDMPERFYEWVMVLRKKKDIIIKESFSDMYSETWRGLV